MDSTIALPRASRYNTRSAKRDAADELRRGALETTEILEQILSYLSPRQIFGVQRVARIWKNVIAGSPTIGEKLFLRLQDKPKEVWMLFAFGNGPNDMRFEKVAPDTHSQTNHWTAAGRTSQKFAPVALSPFLHASRGIAQAANERDGGLNNSEGGEVRCLADCRQSTCVADSFVQEIQSLVENVPTAKEAATDAAHQAVFQTNELVENILVHLPARTIFGVQRVSRSFQSATVNSAPIQEKLFRRKREDPTKKVIVHGFQHIAAMSNPFFAPAAKVGKWYSRPERHTTTTTMHPWKTEHPWHRDYSWPTSTVEVVEGGLEDKYGITVTHAMHVSMKSSLMETYLLNCSCTITRVYLEVRVGEDGPCVFVDQDSIAVEPTSKIGDIVNSALSKACHLRIMSREAAQRNRNQFAAPLKGDHYHRSDIAHSNFLDNARKSRALRYLDLDGICEDISDESNFDSPWRCRAHETPRKVIQALETFCGCPSEIYFHPDQGPTFWLKEVVINTPSEWAEIGAKRAERSGAKVSKETLSPG